MSYGIKILAQQWTIIKGLDFTLKKWLIKQFIEAYFLSSNFSSSTSSKIGGLDQSTIAWSVEDMRIFRSERSALEEWMLEMEWSCWVIGEKKRWGGFHLQRRNSVGGTAVWSNGLALSVLFLFLDWDSWCIKKDLLFCGNPKLNSARKFSWLGHCLKIVVPRSVEPCIFVESKTVCTLFPLLTLVK